MEICVAGDVWGGDEWIEKLMVRIDAVRAEALDFSATNRSYDHEWHKRFLERLDGDC